MCRRRPTYERVGRRRRGWSHAGVVCRAPAAATRRCRRARAQSLCRQHERRRAASVRRRRGRGERRADVLVDVAVALSAQRSSCMPQCAAPPRGSHAALPAAPHRPPATTQPPPQPLPSQPWPLPALPYSPMICHLACAVHCEATSSLQTTRLWQARLGRALLFDSY